MKEKFLKRICPLLTEQEREILENLLSTPLLSSREDFIKQADPNPQYLGPGKWLEVIKAQDPVKNSKPSVRLHQGYRDSILEDNF